MDAFEQVVAELLISKGYWVQTSFKVDLTKEEKREIGRPSAPRWEIDIVALKGATNEILVVECKSYFDSRGVTVAALNLDSEEPSKGGYKLFAERKLRRVVFSRLVKQISEKGGCRLDARVTLGLACGKIASRNEHEKLKAEFASRNWMLLDKDWLQTGLKELASQSYENQVSSVVSKIIFR